MKTQPKEHIMVGILKQHNGLTMEETLQDSYLEVSYVHTPDGYVFEGENDQVKFDLDGNLLESTVQLADGVLAEMKTRASKVQTLSKSI